MSCHSVAVVLTIVQTKQIRINIHKRNNTKTVQTTQNKINTSTHVTKTPIYYKNHTYTHTHTLQNQHIHTPTHYKTHTYTHPHITKPTHTHTHTLQNPHIHTPTITKQVRTTTVQDTHQII